MASLPTHAIAALALGTAFAPKDAPGRFWVWGAALAVAPDLDVVGLGLGIPYAHPFGHRGFSHSLLAALLLAGVAVAWERRRDPGLPLARWGAYLFLAAASHGFLDALTTGGLGVGFFIPFECGRRFLPWRPIRVSPIGLFRFFGVRGVVVLASEAKWVWGPSLVFAGLAILLRTRWTKNRRTRNLLL